jgi:methylthioribulose-1-phosphate dehydratase
MRGAGAVIHTHSQHAVMVTLLYDKEFRITHQEMIKGPDPIQYTDRDERCFAGIKRGWGSSAKSMNYDEELVVPIIENTNQEKDLKARLFAFVYSSGGLLTAPMNQTAMAKAMEEYPESNAVLVRRHGVYRSLLLGEAAGVRSERLPACRGSNLLSSELFVWTASLDRLIS